MDTATDDEEREKPRAPRSKLIAAAREEDIREVLDWMNAQGSEASFRITVTRKWPLVGPGGENIGGVLDTLEERPEDLNRYIADRWGGGSFDVKIEVPSAKRSGGWDYARRGTLKLAGDPKLDPKLHASARPVVEGAPARDSLAERAFESAQRQAQDDRRRADDLERELRQRPSSDPTLISSLMEQIAGLQQQLLAMATKEPPKDEFRDKILQQAVGGESQRVADLQRTYDGRLDKMRDDHASELRQIRSANDDAMKRAEDRHDKAMEAAQRAHERTVTDLTKAHERALDDLRRAHEREVKQSEKGESIAQKTLESAHQAQIMALQAENKRVAADNAELKAQIGSLRAVKEKSPAEQLKDLAGIKENLDALTGGGGGDEGTWYTKLAEVVGNSEAVIGLVERIGGKKDEEEVQQPVQQQVQHPPVGAFARNPADNRMYRHVGNGQYAGPIDENKLRALATARAKRKAAQAQQQQQPAVEAGAEDPIDAALAEVEGGGIDNGLPKPMPTLQAQPAMGAIGKPPKPPSPEDMKKVVEYMESAFTGKQKPENVAKTARSMMSGAALQYIANIGPDRFLSAVAEVKAGSPLVTQLGRTFVRQVAASLFGPQA